MLPKLRIILAAVIATCAAVLALSAGILGARAPGNDLGGVPDLGRTLVRQAIVAEPESQQAHLLAYSRRADELLRLRDLPVTPARAVVEYAEQAQARAAETASAPAATPPADAPPATDSVAVVTVRTATLAPATVAMAPVASPPADTSAATAPQPASTLTAPVAAPPAEVGSASAIAAAPVADTATAAAPNGDTKVAAVQTGGSETAEMYGPEKPKADAKRRHRAKAARVRLSKPKIKPQVTQATRSVVPTTAAGFALEQQNAPPSNAQQDRSNGAFGGWRSPNNGVPR